MRSIRISKMPSAGFSVSSPLAPQAAYQYLINLGNSPLWDSGTLSAENIPGKI